MSLWPGSLGGPGGGGSCLPPIARYGLDKLYIDWISEPRGEANDWVWHSHMICDIHDNIILISMLLQGIIELILATDMAKHGDIMKRYSECLNTGFDPENEEHVQLVS